MTKQLYEEALADVKRVKEVAEANAQRAILEAVTPRIRDLIERELLNEHMSDDDIGAPGSVPLEGDLVTDTVVEPPSAAVAVPCTVVVPASVDTGGCAVSPPVFGEVLPDEEFEVTAESTAALAPLVKAARAGTRALELRLDGLFEAIEGLNKVSLTRDKITQMISRVENMYDHVQESAFDPVKKSSYETKLESHYKDLNQLLEQKMSKKNAKSQVNEADVTLKLTGLPDDVDLDSVGVDLITGEDEEGGAPEGSPEEGGDMDFSDLDLGGDEDSAESEDMGESVRLSDDTIVEIDENMLRREIARMRKLREETEPAAWGDGVGSKEMDDFGGGKDDGDAVLDHEPTTAGKVGEPLGESDNDDLDENDQLDEDDQQMDEQDDDQMDESDYMDEMDQLDQAGNRSKNSTYGAAAAESHETLTWDKRKHESLSRRLAFEKRLQERAKVRASQLKKEASSTRSSEKKAELQREYSVIAKRFNESVDRAKKVSEKLAESVRLQKEHRSNSGSTQPAESKAVGTLRAKLAEANLINAKLVMTNKLLQNETLTLRQKAKVIEQLDAAKTVREAKLVYDSLNKAFAGTSKPVTESRDRKVIGSASRATRPASTQTLNEGWEAERWAKLAGITR